MTHSPLDPPASPPTEGRRPDDPGEIVEGAIVLGFVLVVAVVASVVRAVVDGSSNLLLSAFAAIVAGTVTWLALRKFFYRPEMPLASSRLRSNAKDLAFLGGPPLVALAAALFAE